MVNEKLTIVAILRFVNLNILMNIVETKRATMLLV